jgi:hypothetical protein
LITKEKFWPLGGEIRVLNDFLALAPNPVTADTFLYGSSAVTTAQNKELHPNIAFTV